MVYFVQQENKSEQLLALPVMKFISVAQPRGSAFRMFVPPKYLSVSQHVSAFFPVIMVATG